MPLETVLKRLGLPTHSGVVFESLETHGPSSATALAMHTDLHRPALYRALKALSAAGFIRARKVGKRSVYVAGSRATIRRHFEGSVIADSHAPKVSAGGMRHLEGPEGVAEVFNDVLAHTKRGDTFYRYTSELDLDQVNSYLPADYRHRRDNKRLERLVISNRESGSHKRSRLERFIKFLGDDKEWFRQNAIQLIYGDRIAMIDLNTLETIIIENRTLAAFQKTIFQALYRRL